MLDRRIQGTYSFESVTCETCSFPMLLYEDGCIWWHIPLIALGCVLVAVCIRTMAGGWSKHKVKKKMKKQAANGSNGFGWNNFVLKASRD